MANHPRSVDEAIARFDEVMGRIDRTPVNRDAVRERNAQNRASTARWATKVGIVLAVILAGTIAMATVLDGLGITGLFILMAVIFLGVIVYSMRSGTKRETPIVDYKDDMPNQAVVQRLGSLLSRKRAALPAPAVARLDAISAQLPLLESRLGQADMLDPLAQDARRLMGRHLPELIERYERVPNQFRSEQDAGGLTVDERLVQGLDAARTALDDLGRQLSRGDLDAFETQGRFIESRYREPGELNGQ